MGDVGLPIQGGKYKPYIDSLYQQAEAKRKPLDDRLETSKNQRRVWLETNKNLTDLRLTLSQLRGAESVFGDRVVNSGNEDAMTATVKRHVKPADIEVKVDKRAAADRFFSNDLDEQYQVKAGLYTFVVGTEEINLNYTGGSLSDFSEKLNAINPELLQSSIIQSTAGRQSFLLESQKTGKENKLDFKDAARTFAFDIGLVTDKIEAKYRVENDSQGLRPGSPIDLKQPIKLPQGRYLSVSTLGDVPLDLKPGAYLSFDYKSTERPNSSVKYSISDPNSQTAVREGHLTKETDGGDYALPSIDGEPNIYLKINGEMIPLSSLAPSSNFSSVKFDLSGLKGEVETLVLSNTDTNTDFETRNIELFVPGDVDFVPVNPASVAQDAEFTLDGVKISRATNEIDDVMPGVTFNVKGKSERPFNITVNNDVKKVQEAIENFIWQYYINIAKINTVTSPKGMQEIVDEQTYLSDSQREKANEELGLFQGDMTFLQIKSRLGMMMMNPYTVGEKADKKLMLADIGIRTNEKGTASTSASRRGYYDIKEPDTLKAALENRWSEVQDLFIGIKTEDSPLAKGGLADVMTDFINQYIGNGLIRTRTNTLDGQIKRQEKEVTDFNDRLSDMKKKWEEDFAKAQSAEQEFKRMQQQMNNTFNSNKNN